MGEANPGKIILIVEDDNAVAAILMQALASTYVVFRAAHLKGAREILATIGVDAILLDWRLGHRCGWELLDSLPRKGQNVYPPTLVIGGDVPEEEATKHGAAAVLQKPFFLDVLECTLASILRASPSSHAGWQ